MLACKRCEAFEVIMLSCKEGGVHPQKKEPVRELADELRGRHGIECHTAVLGADRVEFFRCCLLPMRPISVTHSCRLPPKIPPSC